jgi:hypothetical protein
VIPQRGPLVEGLRHDPVEVALESGKEMVLETRIHGASGRPYELRPVGGGGTPVTKNSPLKVGTGKVTLQYERVFGNSSIGSVKIDPRIAGLATGKLELEVEAAPAGRPKSLTPEEAVRAAYDPTRAKAFNDHKPAVEFEVEVVTTATWAKLIDVPKDAVWEKGRGPEDVGLRSRTPLDGVRVRFGAVLTADVIRQLNRAGIPDVEKHFRGKTVRVTGAISKHDHNIYGRTVEVEIVVNDLGQLEVVN